MELLMILIFVFWVFLAFELVLLRPASIVKSDFNVSTLPGLALLNTLMYYLPMEHDIVSPLLVLP